MPEKFQYFNYSLLQSNICPIPTDSKWFELKKQLYAIKMNLLKSSVPWFYVKRDSLKKTMLQIPSSALEQLRELEHLNLNQNNITTIPDRAFHGCNKV